MPKLSDAWREKELECKKKKLKLVCKLKLEVLGQNFNSDPVDENRLGSKLNPPIYLS